MGINRAVYRLFLQDGWKVEIVAPHSLNFPSGKRQAEPPQLGDPLIHYHHLIGNNPRTYHFENLEQLLIGKKPCIVLLDNDPVSRLAVKLGKWCRKNGSRLYCISCENLPLDLLSSIRRKGLKSLPAAIAKRWMLSRTRLTTTGVFTINRDGTRIFKKEGFKQVIKIPLGYDPAYFYIDESTRRTLRTRLGLNKPVIAYFGRMSREKGVHILIKALENLKDLDWALMMDRFDEYAGPYAGEIMHLIREAGFEDRMVWISPDHYEMGGYMNAADLVVVPSVSTPNWKEQYGRVVPEAMACGKTLIISDSGALPELLDGKGYIFKEGDDIALRDILVSIIQKRKDDIIIANEELHSFAKIELSIFSQKTKMEKAFKAS